ncbi:unnamed protein product [Chrysodeixis includens]|uniref:Uncharacterized protein n=1 Tax=Chrysodeixis includens TaxID=689277 RepID=A0A9N8Q0J4_CHRIL|nr:unnamed protein product [Chrysodeixis includens]
MSPVVITQGPAVPAVRARVRRRTRARSARGPGAAGAAPVPSAPRSTWPSPRRACSALATSTPALWTTASAGALPGGARKQLPDALPAPCAPAPRHIRRPAPGPPAAPARKARSTAAPLKPTPRRGILLPHTATAHTAHAKQTSPRG